MQSLCSSIKSAACEVYSYYPTNVNLATACNDTIAANASACASKPSDTQLYLPSTKAAIDQVNSICYEMPGMADCKQCPFPATADCKPLEAYGKLCLEMPGMSQCPDWKRMCDSNAFMKGPFCKGETPSPSSQGTSTPKSSGDEGMRVGLQGMAIIALISASMIF
jgi:hypothetical protein